MTPLRILFVCGRNLRRSPTAAAVYRNDPRVDPRSAGVSAAAQRPIAEVDIEWADLILTMERRQKARIAERFGRAMDLPCIESLDIPDEYQRMDPELVETIRAETEFYLNQH